MTTRTELGQHVPRARTGLHGAVLLGTLTLAAVSLNGLRSTRPGAQLVIIVAAAVATVMLAATALILDRRRASETAAHNALFSRTVSDVVALRRRMATDAARQAEHRHETAATLAGISAAARVLVDRRGSIEPARLDALSSALLDEVRRLGDLVSCGVPRFTPGTDEFDVALAAAPVLVCAEANDVELVVDMPTGMIAKGHGDVLAQVLCGLVANARQHAPGSPVEISVGRRAAALVVRVADRGPGVPGGNYRRIFERGVGTSGSGLGLSVARELLAGIGADITATARLGGGTEFVVWLETGRGESRDDADECAWSAVG